MSCKVIASALILVEYARNVLFFEKRVGCLVEYHRLLVGVFFEELLELNLFVEFPNVGFEFFVFGFELA